MMWEFQRVIPYFWDLLHFYLKVFGKVTLPPVCIFGFDQIVQKGIILILDSCFFFKQPFK